MKRLFYLLITSILILTGCQSQTPKHPLSQEMTLSFFYIETCSQCQIFKDEAIPYLEDYFGETLVIHQYNLDDEKSHPLYQEVIDSLQDFDEEFYGQGPFYALDGYFAKVGYIEGDEKELALDIERALDNEPLSYELESFRYLYKKGE